MARDIVQLHPRAQEIIPTLIGECEKQGFKIKITDCFRSVAEQDALYAQGRTTPGNKVTSVKGSTYGSQHQWGIAFDFCRNDGAGAFNESGQFFENVGRIAKSLNLGWGGDWTSFKDKPHIYLTDWGSTTTALKQKYGTPDKFIATWYKGSTTAPAKQPETATQSTNTHKDWVTRLQREIGAKQDGIAGPETKSKCPLLKSGSRGEIVKLYQEWLNMKGYNCGKADGIFGKDTKAATILLQQAKGLVPDGIAGPKTWSKLLGLK